MPQLRSVQTSSGTISYFLEAKKIKNLNLHIKQDNQIFLSVPLSVKPERADQFILEKSAWISRALAQQKNIPPDWEPLPNQEECRKRLSDALLRVYPLAAPLGVAFPQLKIRCMKSQWGNCHWTQNYITLNAHLARCPGPLQDYIALHELVHFLYHDHGPGFYTQMSALMPDWKQRRQSLKQYTHFLAP